MRTKDPEPQPFRPLGEKVTKAATVPPAPARPVPGAPSGIVQDADGRLRTTNHIPRG